MKKSALISILLPLTVSFNSLSNETDSTVSAERISAFTANYEIQHNNKPVGNAIRKLAYIDESSAEFSYETNIKWLIFSDHRVEKTLVSLDQNKVSPSQYHFKREGTGRDKEFKWQYDIENKKAINLMTSESKQLDWPEGLQDSLSYHLQNRLNLKAHPEQKTFVYPVVNKDGKIKNYVYQYDGEETISLPYGDVKAIKLKREVIEKKRITYAWFAPELDYLMVKLHQSKDGSVQFEAQLTNVN